GGGRHGDQRDQLHDPPGDYELHADERAGGDNRGHHGNQPDRSVVRDVQRGGGELHGQFFDADHGDRSLGGDDREDQGQYRRGLVQQPHALHRPPPQDPHREPHGP